MRRALADAGMQPPDFRDTIATFEVSFPNHTLLDPETLAWIAGIGIDGLNGPQLIALALAKRGVQLTNSSFRAATGVADNGHTPDVAAHRRAEAPWYKTKTKTRPAYLDMIIKLRHAHRSRFPGGRPDQPTLKKPRAVQLAWAEAAA